MSFEEIEKLPEKQKSRTTIIQAVGYVKDVRKMMTKSTTYYWVLAALMSVITLIASYVVVPFGAIPFTLQTMAVVLTGLLIPRKSSSHKSFTLLVIR